VNKINFNARTTWSRFSAIATLAITSLLLINPAQGEDGKSGRTESNDVAEREQLEFFENKIRPLLIEHCFDCHGDGAAEAGLSLDSREGWQHGGDSGPAIIPGDPDKSLLIDAVRYNEERIPGMPPDSRLADKEIKLLEQWVKQGAADPRRSKDQPEATRETFDLQARRQSHWSWEPVRQPDAPQVNQQDWPRDDLDRFILAKLEDAKLSPTDDAEPLTWLRRVSFDLVGLPPTQQHLDAIQNDPGWQTRETIIDELIGSVHFGEKWARHWMDLVRYADSYGHEFDYEIHHAHEYRDYLIRAFNADVPYDQLVREHVAGDLIQSPRRNAAKGFNESIIGTGFWYFHEATHAPTDVLQNEADIISNQIDVFGKAFLGLTVACARCHDHKFDAISTADYYALSAYIQSSCRQDYPLDPNQQNARLADRIEQLRRQTGQAFQSDHDWSGIRKELASRVAMADLPVQAEFKSADESSRRLVDFRSTQLPDGWTTSGIAFQAIGDGLDQIVSVEGSATVPGTVDSGYFGSKAEGILRSPTFEITAPKIHLRMRADKNLLVRLVIDNYQLADRSALLFRGTLLKGGQTDTGGEFKWVTMQGDLQKYLGHNAYLEFVDKGAGSLAVDEIWLSSGRSPENVEPTKDESPEIDELWTDMHRRTKAGRSTPLLRFLVKQKLLPETLQALLAEHAAELKATADKMQAPRYVVAMAEGTREETPIYIRGSHTNRGRKVPPRNLEALGGSAGDRLALADELVSPDNPLTSRVFVNRVWHHLFGRGIVPTVDDFGPQGRPPSHPELLDHLASQFMNNGWSIKKLVRRIVTSRTYGQASVPNSQLGEQQIAAADPTNALLHCMRVRRLPAESIRDAILANSGRLDRRPFGPGVPTHRTPFMTGRGARASGPLDGAGRRSVYLTVYRNFLNPLLTTFDRPNPFGPKGRRAVSNVPAQSLVLMNDPFIVSQAGVWAETIVNDPRPEPQRIRSMVLHAHGRQCTDQQVRRLSEFLEQQTERHQGNRQAAWQDLAHALWNMKAFLYLR
jgi:hypothetical protein